MVNRSFTPTWSSGRAKLELEKLRKQQLGSYSLIFDLEYRSKKSKKIVKSCAIFGSEVNGSRTMRIDMPEQKIAMLLKSVNSSSPSMTLCDCSETPKRSIRHIFRPRILLRNLSLFPGPMSSFLPFLVLKQPSEIVLKSADIYKPVLPGFIFTPADIGFSFIFWDKFTYIGPKKVLGLQTQQFKLEPSSFQAHGLANISYVRISLCTSYGTVIRAEYFDKRNVLLKKMDLLRFKKVNDNWIVTEVTVVDELSHDKTGLRVKKAAFGCAFGEYLSEDYLAETLSKTTVQYIDI
jgi:hypothetical protein